MMRRRRRCNWKTKNKKKKKRRNKWKTKKISNLFFGGLSFFRFFSAVVLNSFVVWFGRHSFDWLARWESKRSLSNRGRIIWAVSPLFFFRGVGEGVWILCFRSGRVQLESKVLHSTSCQWGPTFAQDPGSCPMRFNICHGCFLPGTRQKWNNKKQRQ